MSLRAIVVGDPFNGLQFYGPFLETNDDLAEFANSEFKNETWWICEIQRLTGDMIVNADSRIITTVNGNPTDGFEIQGLYETLEAAREHYKELKGSECIESLNKAYFIELLPLTICDE